MTDINPEALAENDMGRLRAKLSDYTVYRLANDRIGDRSMKLRELFGEETNKALVLELLGSLLDQPWAEDQALEIFASKLNSMLELASEQASAVPVVDATDLGNQAIKTSGIIESPNSTIDTGDWTRIIIEKAMLSIMDPTVDLTALDGIRLDIIVNFLENNYEVYGYPQNLRAYINRRRELEDVAADSTERVARDMKAITDQL